MVDHRAKLKTYTVYYICDKCGEDKMLPIGECLLVYPPLYPHKCCSCEYKKTFDVRYPYVVHE